MGIKRKSSLEPREKAPKKMKVEMMADIERNGCEETIALTSESLQLPPSEVCEDLYSGEVVLPTYKLTDYLIYDKNAYYRPLQPQLIEKNVLLYLSGTIMRPDATEKSEGVECNWIGPISSLWFDGFGKGECPTVGVTTEIAQYYLQSPTETYSPYIRRLIQETYMAKYVIEELCADTEIEFEDLADKIQEKQIPGLESKFDTETLLDNALTICQRVGNFDDAGSDDEDRLMDTDAMKTIVTMAGIDLETMSKERQTTRVKRDVKPKIVQTKAVTTPLVGNLFEKVFLRVMDTNDEVKKEESNEESEDDENASITYKNVDSTDVSIIGDTEKTGKRSYFRCAKLGKVSITVTDVVFLKNTEQDSGLDIVAEISHMYEKNGKYFVHAKTYRRARDTVIGDTGRENEVYQSDSCKDYAMSCIKARTALLKGSRDPVKLFCNKFYDENTGSYTDLKVESRGVLPDHCSTCDRRDAEESANTPKIMEVDGTSFVQWKNQKFEKGDSVFLDTQSFKFKLKKSTKSCHQDDEEEEDYDAVMYPEKYRKKQRSRRNEKLEPFRIGRILSIHEGTFGDGIRIKVAKFYRPEDTNFNVDKVRNSDLNVLFFSEEVAEVDFVHVKEKCYVLHKSKIEEDIDTWSTSGPHRFYVEKKFCAESKKFSDLDSSEMDDCGSSEIPAYPKIAKKLKSLDIFSGCGGLSLGLHQSGLVNTRWAIENNPNAAEAFRLNNPTAAVFEEDCNSLLKAALDGNGQYVNFPRKGEVDVICGGPPCQGFCGMNRFQQGIYSMFKNSLVATFLSYCDHYRPKYFILENVKAFTSSQKHMVLKLTMRCLLEMGYQCSFGVLQAGCYGVPQSRRRLIIFGALPGEVLPLYPEPSHVFSQSGCSTTVTVDEQSYYTNVQWENAAPYRAITVWDAISDLPAITNGATKESVPYGSSAKSQWQRLIRNSQKKNVTEHITKSVNTLVQARIEHIPTKPGSDWRDLPNKTLKLIDRDVPKLRYTHHDQKNGKGPNGALRGVCPCASGQKAKCDHAYKQENTLIPWCLPHTGNKHNEWSGLYGRLVYDDFFSTTVTNPEPMGKQGRVLHPEQNRLVSVRECARSQGFPDTYCFSGRTVDRHRQVGNAVPPPLGRALGQAILTAISQKEVAHVKVDPDSYCKKLIILTPKVNNHQTLSC